MTPDVIVNHDVDHCDRCGNNLEGASQDYDARQIFDLPPITIQVTEHRRLHRTCGVCGKHNIGTFPEGWLFRSDRFFVIFGEISTNQQTVYIVYNQVDNNIFILFYSMTFVIFK